MSETDLKFEDCSLQIHEKLNRDSVKLWLEPYHREGSENDEDSTNALNALADKYSAELSMEKDICKQVLRKLQQNALSKLKEREQFKETGTATIHVKISGNRSLNNSFLVEITLIESAFNLKSRISEKIEIPVERIKLISKGLVLDDSSNLSSQNVKNGCLVMAVVLHGNPSEILEVEKRQKYLEDTKADVQMLAGRSNPNSEEYLQVVDQKGQTLQLPAWERKALVTAMTLHEKGRAALKKDDFALALILFLEADHEFSACNSELLKTVDNYAVLNLDIAWCYLCLQSVTQLPEADERLKKCEQSFHRSYGTNLERLIALKGTAGNEAALFVRLHLLQGVVLYHQNKRDAAKQLLKRAESELNSLKVDDESLSLLLELGYTAAEARLGLRGAQGNVNLAVELINRKKEEKREARKKEREERERKKLGRCSDGRQYVEPAYVKQLTEMGYSEMLALYALQETNNSVSDAVQYIQEHPELSHLTSKEDIIQQQAESLGLNVRAVTSIFRKHDGNVQKALNELLQNGSSFLSAGMNGGCSFNNVDDFDDDHEQREKEKEAMGRIAEDLSVEAEDHLDLTLISEEQFLKKYLELLQ